MGISIYIIKVSTQKDLDAAIADVETHNSAPVKELGGFYEDAAVMDPRRFRIYSDLGEALGRSTNGGWNARFNRGEDISPGGCLVRFNGALYLEVRNSGGGIATTKFLKGLNPNWIGTEGKPEGFYEAPMVQDAESLLELHV